MSKSYRDTFKGAAGYYARYRAAYPDAFFEMIKIEFELKLGDRVLDLGCGTGQIALPISRIVGEVVAMDPEPEMLVEGRIQAEKAAINNVTWVEGGSEDLTDMALALGKFKLVAIGTAFHWMDRGKTLDDLWGMIEDGGGIVIVWIDSDLWRNTSIETVVKKYLGPERRAGSGFYSQPPARHEEVVKKSKFRDIDFWQYPLYFTSDIDSIVGNLYSTSCANPVILGDKKETFEKDLREALLKQNPSGRFLSEGRVEAILAWK